MTKRQRSSSSLDRIIDPDGSPMRAIWRIRKVREEIRPAGWFLANERNWRVHPPSQLNIVAASLSSLGWVDEVKVNLRTHEAWGERRNVPVVLDGHARIVLALREGEDTAVPVSYYDLTPEEETEALLMIDPTAALAQTDPVKLGDLLNEYNTDDLDIRAMLDKLAEDANIDIFKNAPEEFKAVDDDIETDYRCPKCGYEWSGKPK